MNKVGLTTKVENAAWQFGCEAYANREPRNPGPDYRSDIAHYTEYKTWEAMPAEEQQRLRQIFWAGWDKEKTNH